MVYGQPAIAIPVSAVRATASALAASAGAGLRIEAQDLDAIWGPHDAGPLPALLRRTLAYLGAQEPDLTIQLTSTVPIASGMGSGAAIGTALVRALALALGYDLPPAEISALVYESERHFHGTPSGIDNTVVAYERPVWFQRLPGEPALIEPLSVGIPLDLVIGDSGVPSETRASVGYVRQRWEANRALYEAHFTAIGDLVRRARAALDAGDGCLLGRLLDENQSYLAAVGVSSPELDRLIDTARRAGALGAKLSGGGWGGAMVALVRDQAAAQGVAAALQEAGAARVLVTRLDPTRARDREPM